MIAGRVDFLRVAAMWAVIVLSVGGVLTLYVATARYVYGDLDQLPHLTAAHVADPRHLGTTLLFEGRVTDVRTSSSGVVTIRLYDASEDVNVDVPVFSFLGPPPGHAATR